MSTNNNTLIATIGTLSPNQQGTVTISVAVGGSGITNNSLSTTATLSYTNSDGTQGSVAASTMNTVSLFQNGTQTNNLQGYAYGGGSGFFPTTLAGWLAIFAVILGVILISREFNNRSNANKNAMYNSNPNDHYNGH